MYVGWRTIYTHIGYYTPTTQEESNLSSPANSSSQLEVVKQKIHSVRHHKPLSRLPFPSLVGPKCLRLVEMVNNVAGSSRRKKNGSRMECSDSSQQNDEASVEGEFVGSQEARS
ncbi:hypothetical protein P8452_63042 [Trifolium repens]|nr:hypothetical protein P8452_63042 [Trifolium repens]